MSRFQDAINDMQQKMERAIKKVALFVEAEAKLRAPVDTGTLRRSITHETETKKNESIARIGTNVEYAVWVEKGTSRTKAQPFLVPAIEENISQLQQIVKKELEI